MEPLRALGKLVEDRVSRTERELAQRLADGARLRLMHVGATTAAVRRLERAFASNVDSEAVLYFAEANDWSVAREAFEIWDWAQRENDTSPARALDAFTRALTEKLACVRGNGLQVAAAAAAIQQRIAALTDDLSDTWPLEPGGTAIVDQAPYETDELVVHVIHLGAWLAERAAWARLLIEVGPAIELARGPRTPKPPAPRRAGRAHRRATSGSRRMPARRRSASRK